MIHTQYDMWNVDFVCGMDVWRSEKQALFGLTAGAYYMYSYDTVLRYLPGIETGENGT